jgi:(1->4)-alpha-D-glucan 1-alpha-D-glucosylmutase
MVGGLVFAKRRRTVMTSRPSSATYRLQFNRDFTFADARRIIPYLHELGISHVYASPFLKARAGSPHGYDIVDHNALNPEIGDDIEFSAYVQTLRQYNMGQILDIVPNHMGVGGDDNDWWLDVLENGEASAYARYFDIDWHPVNPVLHNKILLPFLGDYYGLILEKGELQLTLDGQRGAFSVRYHDHLFPIDPRTYPRILRFNLVALQQLLTDKSQVFNAWVALAAACQALPRRTELSTTRRGIRHTDGMACKQRLAGLYLQHPEIRSYLDQTITQYNGIRGRRQSFDPLHRLLEAQSYRLAYWQVASDEINYRRFFDINELAGVRMEYNDVFEATHRLVNRLLSSSNVDGLRIDHPDGLSDPLRYFHQLHASTSARSADLRPPADGGFDILVEKVLATGEHLPADWPVAGTTGYEAAHLLNGLFVFADSAHSFSRCYQGFTGLSQNFDELLYERKRLIMRGALSSELSVLANLASAIARSDRDTRDFTYHALHNAIAEIVACFPIYRTYISQQHISDADRKYVKRAVRLAKTRAADANVQVFDFLHGLLLKPPQRGRTRRGRQAMQFALRFQQYTAPVMAKAMEDTTLYSFNRLVSLNDVGFDPNAYGVSMQDFHCANRRRLRDWPRSMVSTSTHDSKRGEDVRARINVLSEIPRQWHHQLLRWSRINRPHKQLVNNVLAPSCNDEYLLYQTLIGTWPVKAMDVILLDAYRQRIQAYMQKAIREAKQHTSWANPNEEYEQAMDQFVHGLLKDTKANFFLNDFISFEKKVERFGLFNSLSQTLLKLTIPGIPDIYQGNEIWAFNLVDPDNRREVDYRLRRQALCGLKRRCPSGIAPPNLLREMLQSIDNGLAKLYITWRTLNLRRAQPGLFLQGDYVELKTRGPGARHICAFCRRLDDHVVIVAASRWIARLMPDSQQLPIGQALWNDTLVMLDDCPGAARFHDVLCNQSLAPIDTETGTALNAGDLFRHFPVALLSNR